MREIKFRAWQTNYKEMYQPLEGYIELNSDDIAVGFSDGDLILEGQDVVLMQYTGLKDKNGKEIYEGDIVQGGVYYGWDTEKGLGVVTFGEWEQDGSGHEYSPKTCLGWFIDIKKSDFNYLEGSHLFRKKSSTLEVIGNIYETPDLLPK